MRQIPGSVLLFSMLMALLATVALSTGCKNNPQPDNVANNAKTGNPEIDVLTDRIQADPGNAGLYVERAKAFNKVQAYEFAIADMASAMKIDSNNVPYHHLLADIYLNSNQSRYALRTMERAAAIAPDSISTLLKLSELQLTLRFYNESMETVTKILRRDPLNADAFVLMGMNFKETGDTAKAVVSFKKAVSLNSDLVDAWLNIAQLKAAKNEPDAIQYFDAAMRVDTSNEAAIHAKAMYLQDHKRPQEAIELYRRIISFNPQYVPAYLNSGILYLDMDSLARASEQFDLALNMEPTYVKAYYFRGIAQERMGDLEKARSNYQQAVSMSPSFDEAAKALEKVKKQLEKSKK